MEPAAESLVKGNINPLVELITIFFGTRSMMSLSSTNEATFQVIIEALLPIHRRVPQLRLVIDGTKSIGHGRCGFVDVFVPGGPFPVGSTGGQCGVGAKIHLVGGSGTGKAWNLGA
jgi:hypothetical protein